ncbi:MAG: GNAT family N-acetyltransferase [Bacilli bacterium]|nr:GNAT family N-acetyltransferase [Bacilli bacterium]
MQKIKKQIVTQRLVLKSLEDKDVDQFVSMLLDTNINKTYMIPDFESEEKAIEFFFRLKKASGAENRFIYGIYLDDLVIGFLNDVDIDGDTIELGYFISSKYWNKGFASEALKAAIEVLFETGFERVIAAHFECNPSSGRVMQKCGMTPFEKEEYIKWKGQNHRCVYYEIKNDRIVELCFVDARKYGLSYLKSLDLLSDEDIAKSMRSKQEIDQKEKLVSCYLKNRFVGDDIYINERGKPLSDKVYFNISHSKGMVCLAISKKYCVGVDIELIRPSKEDLWRFITSDEEFDLIHNDEDFFRIWTLKEAITKADGEGVAGKIPLIPSLPFDGAKEYKSHLYRTKSFLYNDYMTSIALEDEKEFICHINEIEL